MGRIEGRFRVVAAPREDAPGFEETLVEHLRAAPWWFASAAAHAVLFLLLTALLDGGETALAGDDGIRSEVAAPVPEMEEDLIEPEIERLKRIDEDPDDYLETLPVESDLEAEIEALEPDATPGDPRFLRGPFEGAGDNTGIGIGGDARGGGGPEFARGRTRLRGKAPPEALGATDAALDWLARHQSPDGRWDCDQFEGRCRGNRCGGAGGPLHDVGVSGLSLLAFLGAGETHKGGPRASVVRNGLRFLVHSQDAEGCVGSRTSSNFVYDHALGALALAEAYGMTRSPLFRRSAQAGVDFTLRCRNPYMAWRYGVRPQDNDTSVTGWMVMVLKSAALADLAVEPGAFEGSLAFLDRVTEPEYGRAGYTARGNGPARPQELMDRFPADRSESMTAVAVATRIFCGQKPDDPLVRKGTDLLLRCLPLHDEAAGSIDHYYWYYGSLAMFQVGGEPWKRWRTAMERAILSSQRRDRADDRYGSWDPVDPWGPDGGRVYSTALNALSTEVYYRHARLAEAR